MNVSLKNCRSIRIINFIQDRLTSFQTLVNIVKSNPLSEEDDDERQSVAVGLIYVLIAEDKDTEKEQLSALEYFINRVNRSKDVPRWTFNPSEFGGIGDRVNNLLEYVFLHCGSISKMKLLVQETQCFRYLKEVMAYAPKSQTSLEKIKRVFKIFDEKLDINALFSADDSFNISEPNLLLHYFLDEPDIVNFLIEERGADIETVNALGFDFITYSIAKNKLKIASERVKRRYRVNDNVKCKELIQLVEAYGYLSNSKRNINIEENLNHPIEWTIFLKIREIILKYYKLDHHPVFLYILQKLQESTYRLNDKDCKFVRAALILPLLIHLENSRSISYQAIALLKRVIENNIKNNNFIMYKDLIRLLDLIKKLDILVDLDLIKTEINRVNNPPKGIEPAASTNSRPTCGVRETH